MEGRWLRKLVQLHSNVFLDNRIAESFVVLADYRVPDWDRNEVGVLYLLPGLAVFVLTTTCVASFGSLFLVGWLRCTATFYDVTQAAFVQDWDSVVGACHIERLERVVAVDVFLLDTVCLFDHTFFY